MIGRVGKVGWMAHPLKWCATPIVRLVEGIKKAAAQRRAAKLLLSQPPPLTYVQREILQLRAEIEEMSSRAFARAAAMPTLVAAGAPLALSAGSALSQSSDELDPRDSADWEDDGSDDAYIAEGMALLDTEEEEAKAQEERRHWMQLECFIPPPPGLSEIEKVLWEDMHSSW